MKFQHQKVPVGWNQHAPTLLLLPWTLYAPSPRLMEQILACLAALQQQHGGNQSWGRGAVGRKLRLQFCQTTALLPTLSSELEQAEEDMRSQHGLFPQGLHVSNWASMQPSAGGGQC